MSRDDNGLDSEFLENAYKNNDMATLALLNFGNNNMLSQLTQWPDDFINDKRDAIQRDLINGEMAGQHQISDPVYQQYLTNLFKDTIKEQSEILKSITKIGNNPRIGIELNKLNPYSLYRYNILDDEYNLRIQYLNIPFPHKRRNREITVYLLKDNFFKIPEMFYLYPWEDTIIYDLQAKKKFYRLYYPFDYNNILLEFENTFFGDETYQVDHRCSEMNLEIEKYEKTWDEYQNIIDKWKDTKIVIDILSDLNNILSYPLQFSQQQSVENTLLKIKDQIKKLSQLKKEDKVSELAYEIMNEILKENGGD